jgi:hypothetical protein
MASVKAPKVAYPHDFAKLRGKIIEKYGKNYAFAAALGISTHTLSERLNNQRPWNYDDISRSIEILEIPEAEVFDYFFAKQIQNS